MEYPTLVQDIQSKSPFFSDHSTSLDPDWTAPWTSTVVIFSSRWDGNDFFLGNHCMQWFFNGFAATVPPPLNVFLQIDH